MNAAGRSEIARLSQRDEVSRLKDELDLAQRRLEVLTTGIRDAVVWVDGEGDILGCSVQAEKLLGWSEVELSGRSFARHLISPEHRSWHLATLATFRQTGDHTLLYRRFRRVLLHRDGSRRLVELRILPVEIDGEHEFTVLLHDSARQAKRQTATSNLGSQLSDVVHSIYEGIFSLDVHGVCTFANTACVRLLGYQSPSELIGRKLHDIIHYCRADGSNYPESECLIHETSRSGIGVHVTDEVFFRRCGAALPVEYWAYPVNSAGELGGTVVSFVDITERKGLEQRQENENAHLEEMVSQWSVDLAATQYRLELAMHGGNVGLWDWNNETNEVFYSDSYKKQLGYPPTANWSHFDDWVEALHPDDKEGAFQTIEEYYRRKSGEYVSVFRMKARDGSYRWLLARGKGQFDIDGKPLRMLGVHVDITQEKQDEQELQRLNIALEAANNELQNRNIALQQFAFVASHDLQTPLRAIVGFAQFLQDDYRGRLDDTADDYIERIVGGATRMQAMIHDLLEYSRLERQELSFQSVEMENVVDDAIELLQTAIQESGGSVTHSDLPVIQGDRRQMVQLMQNVLGNSLKYCAESPKVHVAAELQNGEWLFSIQDNGIGIPENQFEKIFDIFQRLHSREQYPGTGIGLAVCKQILAGHQGKIWVDSTLGKGSTFYFTLPESS
ncbi:PAS domain-containing sensor histidine kinase [Stieleria varia]|uniref:histidine kinase n=1 Tax=Stieleria varia TaxID=2528005 RepID=A0A5C6BB05_9BACT|nr:PAS domain S-box protein [Stieleria varia]TWU08459.1 Phytochrome-like protein cph1 [Stieleria varia]